MRSDRQDSMTFHRSNRADPDTLDLHIEIIREIRAGLITENAASDPVPGGALGYDVRSAKRSRFLSLDRRRVA